METVDNFACNQLDKMENKYPIIKESSENVLKSSSEYYDSSIKPNVDKLVSAKDSVVNIAMTPFRIASQSIDYLSSTTNSFVNRYMSSNTSNEIRTVDKKEYDILFGRALKEIDTIRYYSKSTIEGLSNVLSSIYDQSIKRNQELINKYYQEYVGEIHSHDSEHASTESTLMQIVTSLSNKLRVSVRAMSTVCYSHVSAPNQERLDAIFHKTEQLYSTLSQATYSNVREQISIDNVKAIGQSTVELLANISATLVNKYRAEIGETPALAATAAAGDGTKDEVGFAGCRYRITMFGGAHHWH